MEFNKTAGPAQIIILTLGGRSCCGAVETRGSGGVKHGENQEVGGQPALCMSLADTFRSLLETHIMKLKIQMVKDA